MRTAAKDLNGCAVRSACVCLEPQAFWKPGFTVNIGCMRHLVPCAPRSLRLDANQKVLHAHVTSNPCCSNTSARIGKRRNIHCATLPSVESQPKNANALGSSKGSVCRTTPNLEMADASVNFAMRYLLEARVKSGHAGTLANSLVAEVKPANCLADLVASAVAGVRC
jgi:hypothetical protein